MSLRLLSAIFLAAISLQANVRLPHILSSHMVLQRNRPIHIWGWAADAATRSSTLAQTRTRYLRSR